MKVVEFHSDTVVTADFTFVSVTLDTDWGMWGNKTQAQR